MGAFNNLDKHGHITQCHNSSQLGIIDMLMAALTVQLSFLSFLDHLMTRACRRGMEAIYKGDCT